MRRKVLLRTAALLLSLFLCLPLVGCSASRAVRANTRAGRVVATAGDVDILYESLYFMAMSYIKTERDAHGEDHFDDPAAREELENYIKENLVTRHDALFSIAAEMGLDPEKGELGDDVQERMDGIIENYFEGDRDAYIESLNAEYLTDRYVRRYLAATEFLPSAIVNQLLIEGKLDDSDDTAREIIESDDFVHVAQILIETRNFADAEAALARAEALRDRVAAKTDDDARYAEFFDVWAFGTQDTNADKLYFGRGEMTAEFEKAAFALPLYGVSEVIATQGGYTFLMALPKDEAYVTQNFESLKQKTYYIALNEMVDERLEEMPLEMTDYGRGLDLLDLPAVDADGGEALIAVLVSLGAVLVVGGVVLVVFLVRRKHGKKPAKKKKYQVKLLKK